MDNVVCQAAHVKEIPVRMQDGSTFIVKHLLDHRDKRKNTKLRKSDKHSDWFTRGLSLAPARVSGFQVCPNSTGGCRKACIYTSGYAGIFRSIRTARIAKTRAWFMNRPQFKRMLIRDIYRAQAKADSIGKELAIRLNVFSDIPWERQFPEVFDLFPEVQFYDYTKSALRALQHVKDKEWPENYHLTFSRSETNDEHCLGVLRAGGNVAVVFDSKDIPSEWNGFEVVNGDKTDLRFLDGEGVVVGLYAKGRGRKDKSGFVVPSRVPLHLVSA